MYKWRFFPLRTSAQNRKKKENEENLPEKSTSNQHPKLILEDARLQQRQFKIPRALSEEDKELYSIISRDVLKPSFGINNETSKLHLNNVVGLVRLFKENITFSVFQTKL